VVDKRRRAGAHLEREQRLDGRVAVAGLAVLVDDDGDHGGQVELLLDDPVGQQGLAQEAKGFGDDKVHAGLLGPLDLLHEHLTYALRDLRALVLPLPQIG
jgi:hypothetical protein